MAIEDRNLAVGTKLVARNKKQVFTCEGVQTDEGVRYRLADGAYLVVVLDKHINIDFTMLAVASAARKIKNLGSMA